LSDSIGEASENKTRSKLGWCNGQGDQRSSQRALTLSITYRQNEKHPPCAGCSICALKLLACCYQIKTITTKGGSLFGKQGEKQLGLNDLFTVGR